MTLNSLAASPPSRSSSSFLGASPKIFHHCFIFNSLSNRTPTRSASRPRHPHPAEHLGGYRGYVPAVPDGGYPGKVFLPDFPLVEGDAAEADAAVIHGEAVALGSDEDVRPELIHLALDVAGHGQGKGRQGDDGGNTDRQADGEKRHLGLAPPQVVEGNVVQVHTHPTFNVQVLVQCS